MFKLPMKFYTMSGGGGESSDTSTSNKKYEITITQPPKHESRPDFIRGIPYAAKDNMMFCKIRAMTLDDLKEMNPEGTEVPSNTKILQDHAENDIIITSDMIESIVSMNLFIQTGSSSYIQANKISFNLKQEIDGDTLALLMYEVNNNKIFVKISDVDFWFNAG